MQHSTFHKGSVVGYDLQNNLIEVLLTTTPTVIANKKTVNVQYSPSFFSNNGLFIGTFPEIGTEVIVSLAESGEYRFVSFTADGFSELPKFSESDLDKLFIRGNDNSKIILDVNSNITIGSDVNNIHTFTGNIDEPDSNFITINFKNENHFTQAYREIGGLVKRDLRRNKFYSQYSKLTDNSYDSEYKIIGMDPSVSTNNLIYGSTKNPPFVEHRELVYEFQYQSNVTNDLKEALQYGKSKQTNDEYYLPDRRKSRADTLSLTLLEPNYLIETIKGTVVDIFGNILDLNRYPLQVGKTKDKTATLDLEKGEDIKAAYLKIREQERKSLAFHFEINARKDLSSKSAKTNILDILDIKSNKNNSTIRSRFFIDIDKEGQFKINVPASSEKGNIPLLTRYENISSFSTEDNNNPNQLLVTEEKQDIYLDSFAASEVILAPSVGFKGRAKARGTIKLKNDKGEAAPKDRITEVPIMHGTAHHDILNTCYALASRSFIDYQNGTNAVLTVDINTIPLLENIVSDTIIIDGDKEFDKGGPNAGGRSGSINCDGMLEFNIGANTIDRQSLWMDLAGGSVINLGRDRKSRSAVVQADGDVYMQIGSYGITGDTRFVKDANNKVGAVLDLRIMNNGNETHIIRCDDKGIIIMTPGELRIHSTGNMRIQTDGSLDIDCEQLTLMERGVQKLIGSV